jgi:hypothetical protein
MFVCPVVSNLEVLRRRCDVSSVPNMVWQLWTRGRRVPRHKTADRRCQIHGEHVQDALDPRIQMPST